MQRGLARWTGLLLGLSAVALLLSEFAPQASVGLCGGRCVAPFNPVTWGVRHLAIVPGMAAAVFSGLAITAVVGRRAIAIGALVVGAVAAGMATDVVVTVVVGGYPVHIVPPVRVAIGPEGYLMAAGAALAAGAAVLTLRDRRPPALDKTG